MKRFLRMFIWAYIITFFSICLQFGNSSFQVSAWSETDIPVHVQTIGGYARDGQLDTAVGVATDSTGNIYVVENTNNRVQKFTSSGVFQLTFGSYGSGDGQFNTPFAIAVDNSDNIYVTDRYNHRIQKFNSNGEFLFKFGTNGTGDGQFSYPIGVAVDDNENIYVVDALNKRVQKFNSSGGFLFKFGSSGTADGQFGNYPWGIAVDSSENMYVTDPNNRRVQVFNSSGVFQFKFGTDGAGDGQFWGPNGITLDDSNHIYVSDEGNNRIQRFTNSGVFELKFGSNGTADGQFSSPYGVAVDSSGNIHVADSSNRRIQVFNNSGEFLQKFGSNLAQDDGYFSAPNGIAVDSSGNMYVVETSNNRVQKFDSNGEFLLKFGSNGSGNGQFNAPNGIAVDSSGNIYVADTNNSRIQVFNNSGVFQFKFGANGAGNGQFSGPNGVAIDSSGNIYVAEVFNRRIQVLNSSGVFQFKFGSSGTGNGQFNNPYDLEVGSSGKIYVADFGNHRVQVFDNSGVFLFKFGSNGTADGQFNFPRGITVDSEENIYVGDKNNNRIQKFSSIGVFKYKFGSYGTEDGKFKYPTGLAVDSNGNINIADAGNSRIQRFIQDRGAPTGSLTINSGIASTGTSSVTLATTATDELSSVIDMIISESSEFSGASWEAYATTKAFTLSAGEGTKTVYVKYRDTYATESVPFSDTIIYDITPPTGSATINGGDSLTNSKTITMTLPATDSFSAISDMMLSESDTFVGANWETYTSSTVFTLTDTDGTKTVYVKFKDVAGNISEVYSDTIMLDSAAPTGSFLINSGMTLTNNRALTLTLTATDNLSTVAETIISENADFTGSSYEAYGVSRVYELTSAGDGIKTVYVKFKDALGNESITYSAEIELDTTAPPAVVITHIGFIHSIPNKTRLFYYFTSQVPKIKGIAEALSTVHFKPLLGSTDYTVTADNKGKFTIIISDPVLPRGSVSLDYYATDSAGNKSVTKTLNLVIGEEHFPKPEGTNITEDSTLVELPETSVTEPPTPSGIESPTPIMPSPKYVTRIEQIDTNSFLSEFRVKLIDEQGNPLKGVLVSLHSELQQATTDILGVAIFKNVQVAEHTLAFAYKGEEIEKNIVVQVATLAAKEIELEPVIVTVRESRSGLVYFLIGLIVGGALLSFILYRRSRVRK